MSKLERCTTPVGESYWAHLHTPKPAFTDPSGVVRGEAKYQLDVVFDPASPEWKAWASALKAKWDALPVQTDKRTGEQVKKVVLFKRQLDDNDQPTGKVTVTFKTSAKFAPGVFDAYGRPIPPDKQIGNGSLVRVNYSPSAYEGFGGGLTLYLNAVQVVKLIERAPASATAYGFEVQSAPEDALVPTTTDAPSFAEPTGRTF